MTPCCTCSPPAQPLLDPPVLPAQPMPNPCLTPLRDPCLTPAQPLLDYPSPLKGGLRPLGPPQP